MAWKGAKNTFSELVGFLDRAGSASLSRLDRLTGGSGGSGSLLTQTGRSASYLGKIAQGDWKGLQEEADRDADADRRAKDASWVEAQRQNERDWKNRRAAREAPKREAEARAQTQRETMAPIREQLARLQYGDEVAARMKFQDDLIKRGFKDRPLPAGISLGNVPAIDRERMASLWRQDLTAGMMEYDRSMAEMKRRKEAEEQQRKDREQVGRIEETARDEDPVRKYDNQIARLNDLWNRGELQRNRTRTEAEQVYWAAARKYLGDYYREAHDLDAKGLRRELETPTERYRRKEDSLVKAEQGGLFGPGTEGADLAARARDRNQEDFRRGLGIRSPELDYGKQIRELEEAKRASAADRQRRSREIEAAPRPMDDATFQRRQRELDQSRSGITNEEYLNRRRELEAAREPLSAEGLKRRYEKLDKLRPKISDADYQRRRRDLEAATGPIGEEEFRRRQRELDRSRSDITNEEGLVELSMRSVRRNG
jgi:hypothetical protein